MQFVLAFWCPRPKKNNFKLMTGMSGGAFQVEESWKLPSCKFTLVFYVRSPFRELIQSVALIFDKDSWLGPTALPKQGEKMSFS